MPAEKSNFVIQFLDSYLNRLSLRPEERSKRIFTGLAVIAAGPFAIVFSIVYFLARDYVLASFLLFVAFFLMISLLIGRRQENAIQVYRCNILVLGSLFLFLIATSESYPNRMLWGLVFPLISYYLVQKREGLIYNAIYYSIIIGFFLFHNFLNIHIYNDLIFKIEFLCVLLILTVISYSFENVKSVYQTGIEEKQAALEVEKEKLSEANRLLKKEIHEKELAEKSLTESEKKLINANNELQEMYERVKAAEEELSAMNIELEKRVQHRTKELQKVNEQLTLEISERVKTTLKLAESETKYRALFEDSLEAMSLTKKGIVVDVNPAWLRLHAFENKEDIIGKDILSIIHPDNRHLIKIRRKYPSNGYNEVVQQKDLRSDGTTIDVEVYSSEIEIGGERVILATIRDITEKLKTEKIKRDLEEKLRRAEKMEVIGILAGGVAHDLNNILSGLVAYPDILLMELPKDSVFRKSVETIKRSGERAAAIVQDLLTLARRGVENAEILNLNTIVEDYINSAEFEKIGSLFPNITFKTHLDDSLLNIKGSPTHLSKTLMNLVSNAAEAMTEGGDLIIKTENRYVDKLIAGYDHVEEGDYSVLSVSDQGVGISNNDLKRIFEPFFTKKEMGRSGTGLGMTVVWGTVKDHKGYIDVESKEGKGTEFTLYFPSSRENIMEEKLSYSIEELSGDGESILIIDDIAEQREIASSILLRLGYEVSVVSSGEAALDFLKDSPVDLLVLDMILETGMDGLDTFKEVLKINPNQRAIIASGFSETERVREAQSLGAGKYITKPYTLEKIGIAVKEELEKT